MLTGPKDHTLGAGGTTGMAGQRYSLLEAKAWGVGEPAL